MDAEAGRVFGRNVTHQRKLHGLTQRQLAQAVGMSHQLMSSIEQGHLPSMGVGLRLARFFKVPVSALVGDLPLPPGDQPDADPMQIRVIHLCREVIVGPVALRQMMGGWLRDLGTRLHQLPSEGDGPPDPT